LIVHFDRLKERSEVPSRSVKRLPIAFEAASRILRTCQSDREISATPRDIKEESRADIELQNIHPDRLDQVHGEINNISDLDLDSPEPCRQSHFIKETKQFIKKSRKQKKAMGKKTEILSRTRSGKIPAKPTLTKKQRNRLQAIPKDILAEYITARK